MPKLRMFDVSLTHKANGHRYLIGTDGYSKEEAVQEAMQYYLTERRYFPSNNPDHYIITVREVREPVFPPGFRD